MQKLTTNDGCELAYYVDDFTKPWSSPEVVLLLHPCMSSALRWFSWVPRLSSRYRVVRVDLRGHGNSQLPKPEEDFSLALLVNDAVQLLDHLGVRQAHIVGNSAGGYIAQQLAIHHPARVKSLSLFAATPGLKNSHASTWIPQIKERGLKRFLADTIHERFDDTVDPNLIAWFIEQASSNNAEFIMRFMQHMCTHDFMDELGRIEAPTLMVAAGGEQIGSTDAYKQMQERIKGSRLVYLKTTGHNIGDGFPERCVDELLAFLQSLQQTKVAAH